VTASSGSDEASTLDAIRHAKFSLWRTESHHETGGLVVKDMLRDKETWLVDKSLTDSAEPGLTFAARLCWLGAFAMTRGVVVPVNADWWRDTLIDNMACSITRAKATSRRSAIVCRHPALRSRCRHHRACRILRARAGHRQKNG
jgi:hypothetical protein